MKRITMSFSFDCPKGWVEILMIRAEKFPPGILESLASMMAFDAIENFQLLEISHDGH